MIKPIVHDDFFLARKSEPATPADIGVLNDLTETLIANRERCVGMAANMIGVSKRIISVLAGPIPLEMINPVIVAKLGAPYEAEEGCLCRAAVKKVQRYETIEVEYLDRRFQKQRRRYTGWIAQIIQHEIDHCEGILI